MSKEFKSFYKTVGGNEGTKCHYPTRLDTYGCGCAHDCKYCYAKSLLAFRKLWNPEDPSVVDTKKVERLVRKIPRGSVVRLGGMTDCFQPCELKHRATFRTIKILNRYRIGYLIVTKSGIVGYDEYLDLLDPELAHVQITTTTTDAKISASLEVATAPEGRIWAAERLQAKGIDTALRLSPYLPGLIDLDRIKAAKVDKIVLEFLRVNSWTRKWIGDLIDLSPYTLKSGGYQHLPLDEKKKLAQEVKDGTGKVVSVCEDEDTAYEFWKSGFNPNPDDCCNLTFTNKGEY